MSARSAFGHSAILDLALGVWLAVSTLLWRHTRAELDNTWLIAGLIIISSVAWRAGWTHARGVNLALAGWLFLSSLFWPRVHPAATLNEIVVAILLAVFTFRQPTSTATTPIAATPAPARRRRRRR